MRNVFTALILIAPLCLQAQDVYNKDSLWQAFNKSSADTNRVNILIQLGQQYEGNLPDSALALYNQAYELSQSLNYKKGVLKFYANATYIYNMQGKYDTSLVLNLQSVQLAKDINNEERLLASLTNVGSTYLYLEEFEKSIEYSLQALEIAEPKKNNRALTVLYSNLANVYRSLKRYDQASEYATRGLALARKVNNPYNISAALITVGLVRNFQMRADDAIPYFEEAILTARKLGDLFTLLSALVNLNDANMKLGNYPALEPICREALKVAEQIDDPAGVAIGNRGLGYYYLYARNLPESERYAQIALSHALRHGLKHHASQAYVLLSELALLKNKNRLYQLYQVKSDSIQEIIFSEQRAKNIQRLELQFQMRQRERQLQELQLQTELKEKNLRQSKWLIASLLGLLLVIAFSAWMQVRATRQRKELAERESELNKAKVAQLENERQLLASQAVINGQEQERGRLAKDLHDGLGGMLSGIKFSLSHMKSNMILDADNALQFERSLDMLDHSISELRRVAHNMMPEVLVKFGLGEALKGYCESFRQSKVFDINFQLLGEAKRLESNTEIISFRIAQELLNNVMKHAKATQVLVQLSMQINEINLTIEDNGVGFDTNALNSSRGAGWASIQSRVDFLKGKVDVQSSINAGTSVHVTIPLA